MVEESVVIFNKSEKRRYSKNRQLAAFKKIFGKDNTG